MKFKKGDVVIDEDGELYTIKTVIKIDTHPYLVFNHSSKLSYWVKESYIFPTYGFNTPLWKVLNGEDYDE